MLSYPVYVWSTSDPEIRIKQMRIRNNGFGWSDLYPNSSVEEKIIKRLYDLRCKKLRYQFFIFPYYLNNVTVFVFIIIYVEK
jgi:hypothetical protein